MAVITLTVKEEMHSAIREAEDWIQRRITEIKSQEWPIKDDDPVKVRLLAMELSRLEELMHSISYVLELK